jgi:hypothetical protein
VALQLFTLVVVELVLSLLHQLELALEAMAVVVMEHLALLLEPLKLEAQELLIVAVVAVVAAKTTVQV